MTTDPTPLQERIARILNDEGWTFEGVHEPGDYDGCEDCRRVVDPIAARIAGEVTAEVRAAKAEAWDEGCEAFEIAHKCDNAEPWGHLRDNPYRATEYETGDQA